MKSQISIFLLLCSFFLLFACSNVEDQTSQKGAAKSKAVKTKNIKKTPPAKKLTPEEEKETIVIVDQLATEMDASTKAINLKAKETEEGVRSLLEEINPTK